MKTVLIAEDDAGIRRLLIDILETAGYQVLAAVDGQDGWELLQARGADMAVLDLNMPRKDGIALMKLMRGHPKFERLPILMLTVRALVEDQLKGYAHGADDYLTKPFDGDMLVARLRALERRAFPKS